MECYAGCCFCIPRFCRRFQGEYLLVRPFVVAPPPITRLVALLAAALGIPLCGAPMLVGDLRSERTFAGGYFARTGL